MFILTEKNRDVIWQLPTPVAATALSIYNAGSWKELFEVLRFFSSTTHGFLHSLAFAVNKYSVTKKATEDVVFFDPAWKWANTQEIARAWNCLGKKLPLKYSKCLPPMETKEWKKVKKQIASNHIVGRAKNWIDAVNLLDKQDKLLSLPIRKEHWEKNNYVNEIEEAIDLVLNNCLYFLRYWALFYVDMGCDAQECSHGCTGIMFVGPTPIRRQIKIKSCCLPYSRMHVQMLDLPPLSLEPYCLYENISGVFHASHNPLEISEKRTLHVLSNFGVQSVKFSLPELGVRINRNDLYNDLLIAASHCIGQSISSKRLTWGLMVIRIHKMRILNTDLGHSVADNILMAMDRCAAQYTNTTGIIRQPALYPFWRHGDEMLIPFSFSEQNAVVNIQNAVFETGSRIAAAAQSALPRGYDRLALDIGFYLNAGTYRAGDEERFGINMLISSEKLRKQLKKTREEVSSTTNVLWLEHDTGSEEPIFSTDGLFTRISIAAFGIVARKTCDQEMEILLRFNHNHGGYNLIGGHIEAVDNNMPSNTMQRELFEEIDLEAGKYKFYPLFNSALRAIEFSDHKSAWTCYFHNFYIVSWKDIAEHLDTDCPPECKWFKLGDLEEMIRKEDTEIRTFPLKHILKYLQSLDDMFLEETVSDMLLSQTLPISLSAVH